MLEWPEHLNIIELWSMVVERALNGAGNYSSLQSNERGRQGIGLRDVQAPKLLFRSP